MSLANTMEIKKIRKDFKILIVEINPELIGLISILLSEYDVVTKTVKTFADGLVEAVTGNYDFLVINLNLGDLNGFSLASVIRKIEQKTESTKSLPIIAIAEFAQNLDYDKVKKSGFSDYLHKDEIADKLPSIIKNYLN